jgi:cysteinyl-tRNA synthetase
MDNRVSMYVCGVTVYDFSHIGHARAYVAFDVLYRYLKALGYEVTYIRNFTDVDDKIITRANKEGEDPTQLSQRFINEFHIDMDMLGCERPSMEPRATEFIPSMIESIQRIMDHGHAYVVDQDVYFDVTTLPGYGALSGRSLDDNRAGERVDVDRRKRHPSDFALWKAAKPGEPTWDSPWGAGRPGWHIECSAMIEKILGPVVDIHGGGRDLVFPHHENELAQARAAAGPCSCDHADDHQHKEGAFARFWVHNGFVNVDAEKMSKSLGNFFTIRDVLKQYHPLALRLFLLNTQYRQGINYTQRGLEEASDRLYYLFQTLRDMDDVLSADNSFDSKELKDLRNEALKSDPGASLLAELYESLADDLNTPVAIAVLSSGLKAINDLMHTKQGRKQKNRIPSLLSYRLAVVHALNLLGLYSRDSARILSELRACALVRSGITEHDVAKALEERTVARAAKDFAAADAVRSRLEQVGILIMDTPQGTTWKPGPRLDVADREG